jgi:hypothetical protein
MSARVTAAKCASSRMKISMGKNFFSDLLKLARFPKRYTEITARMFEG